MTSLNKADCEEMAFFYILKDPFYDEVAFDDGILMSKKVLVTPLASQRVVIFCIYYGRKGYIVIYNMVLMHVDPSTYRVVVVTLNPNP